MGDTNMTLLRDADRTIRGARHRDYGPPSRDLGRTGALWTALLRDRLRPGQRLTGADVAWMMALLKASRAQETPGKRDHYLDAAGYVACGWECVQEAVRDACKRVWAH